MEALSASVNWFGIQERSIACCVNVNERPWNPWQKRTSSAEGDEQGVVANEQIQV
jgi:hypothetical protein